MNTIAYIGMDVHTTNYTLCAISENSNNFYGRVTVPPEFKELERYFKNLHEKKGITHFICGYEAGCLGYSLYYALTEHQWKGFSVECLVIAPTSLPMPKGGRIKTDTRDALMLAQSMFNGTCSYVYIPDQSDEAVKEFIRMRDDTQQQLVQTKLRINAMCLRQGYAYKEPSRWTQKHLEWLKKLQFKEKLFRETLDEYLFTLNQQTESVARYDRRIEELAQAKRYNERVRMLCCLKGIGVHTALSLLVEVGDFNRFPAAKNFSHYLGLVPGENSSSTSTHRLGITKSGNNHLRWLLVEAANCYSRGNGLKTKAMKAKQEGCPKEIIAYADRAALRLRKKYVRIQLRSKACIAKVAIARELACFVWGMMTGHTA